MSNNIVQLKFKTSIISNSNQNASIVGYYIGKKKKK